MSPGRARAGAGWSVPADVRAAVTLRWNRGSLLRDLSVAGGPWESFPLRVSLRGPSRDEFADRFAEAAAWARRLADAAAAGGWELLTAPRRVPGVGTQPFPVAAVVPTPQAALRLLGRAETAAAARFAEALAAARELGPSAAAVALARPHDVLDAGPDWHLLLALAGWLAAHPRPGVHPRQIPVAGVHTKVLERHTGLLGRLAEPLLPPEAVDSSARSFAARFGLAVEPRRVRVRGAAAALGVPTGAGDVGDVEWDLNALACFDPAAHGIAELLVTENKTSFRTVPAPAGRLVLWGAGYGADDLLAALPWRAAVAVRYWGDIDTHGFAILAAVRRTTPHTGSLLMDTETLLEHRPFWGTETAPRTEPLSGLTTAEETLYAQLCAGVHGPAVRLEQEFIRFDRVNQALRR